jgi:hypothetical protein
MFTYGIVLTAVQTGERPGLGMQITGVGQQRDASITSRVRAAG